VILKQVVACFILRHVALWLSCLSCFLRRRPRSTVKVVHVNDKRLGILHYCFLFLIVMYIVVYTLLMNKAYLLTETPMPSFRLSLRRADAPQPLADLDYCLQTQPSVNGFPKYTTCGGF